MNCLDYNENDWRSTSLKPKPMISLPPQIHLTDGSRLAVDRAFQRRPGERGPSDCLPQLLLLRPWPQPDLPPRPSSSLYRVSLSTQGSSLHLLDPCMSLSPYQSPPSYVRRANVILSLPDFSLLYCAHLPKCLFITRLLPVVNARKIKSKSL